MTDAPKDAMFDIAVIGAGAAGMSAAYEAVAHGHRVVVIDANPRPGGQYHRRSAADETYRPSGCNDDLRWKQIQIRTGWQVFAADALPGGSGIALRMRGDDRHMDQVQTLSSRILIVATGAVDRQLAIPGWQLPGVMAGGGAQSLIKGSGVLPGRRTLVTGTGPFLLAVAASILQAGGEVAGVIEANSPAALGRYSRSLLPTAIGKSAEAARFAMILARHRVPYLTQHRVTQIHAGGTAEGGVTAATVSKVDKQWRPIPGRSRDFEVDCVTLGFGFTPQLDILLQLGCAAVETPDGGIAVRVDGNQVTSIPIVLAAGETTGVGGVELAAVEGQIAGIHARRLLGQSRSLTKQELAEGKQLHRKRRHLRNFATALARGFPVPTSWLDEQAGHTVVCRCEEVSLETVQRARDDLGATDARSVKLLTRAGMGWCQGRMCAFSIQGLCPTRASVAAQVATANRPISIPVSLGAIARQTK